MVTIQYFPISFFVMNIIITYSGTDSIVLFTLLTRITDIEHIILLEI